MTVPNQSQLNQPTNNEAESSESIQEDSMEEYYQLKNRLLLVTLMLTVMIFGCVWWAYSLNIALNYLLGGCVGVVYLRMLAREVETLGGNKRSFGSTRLALFIALMIIATQWQQLSIMPVFLGFMTYKATIIFYVLPTTLIPAPSNKNDEKNKEE